VNTVVTIVCQNRIPNTFVTNP